MNSELSSNPIKSPPRRSGAVRAGAMLAVLTLLAVIPLFWPKPDAQGSGANESSRSSFDAPAVPPLAESRGDEALVAVAETAAEIPAVEPEPVSKDAQFRETVLGQWTQYDHGPRRLTVHEDGTGTMVVEPDGAWAYVIGAKVTMDVEWTIENGRVNFKSVRGTPKTSFEAITRLFGSERDREIVELTDKRLVLLDTKDGSKSEWTRVE